MDKLTERIVKRVSRQQAEAIDQKVRAGAAEAERLEKWQSSEVTLALKLLDFESKLNKIRYGERHPSRLNRIAHRLGRNALRQRGSRGSGHGVLSPFDWNEDNAFCTQIYPAQTYYQSFRLPTDELDIPDDENHLVLAVNKCWLFELHRPPSNGETRLVTYVYRCGEDISAGVAERELRYRVKVEYGYLLPGVPSLAKGSSAKSLPVDQLHPPNVWITTYTHGQPDYHAVKREEASIAEVMGLVERAEQAL